MDAKPNVLQGKQEQPGSRIIEEIFKEIYFDGNWNRGFYEADNAVDGYNYKQKQDLQKQFYRPLTVFGDDGMFHLCESQKKQNREQRILQQITIYSHSISIAITEIKTFIISIQIIQTY